jgi:ribosome-associated protein
MIRINETIAIAESEVTFRFFTSSGPGGQNVNKVATAAQLRFDAGASPSLPEDVVHRLSSLAGRRMSSDGVVLIKAQRYRSQERNRKDAMERLVTLISRAAESARPRTATRPSRSAVHQRLTTKVRRGVVKRSRGPVDDDV